MKREIVLTQLVDDDELDHDDARIIGRLGKFGTLRFPVNEPSRADYVLLDRFHGVVPIANMFNYSVDVETVPSSRTRSIKVNDQQLHTILAALRVYQAVLSGEDTIPDVSSIATDGGTVLPLFAGDIDLLCEAINQ